MHYTPVTKKVRFETPDAEVWSGKVKIPELMKKRTLMNIRTLDPVKVKEAVLDASICIPGSRVEKLDLSSTGTKPSVTRKVRVFFAGVSSVAMS